jgi:hypothetical protein
VSAGVLFAFLISEDTNHPTLSNTFIAKIIEFQLNYLTLLVIIGAVWILHSLLIRKVRGLDRVVFRGLAFVPTSSTASETLKAGQVATKARPVLA